jgi:hypothetical protein
VAREVDRLRSGGQRVDDAAAVEEERRAKDRAGGHEPGAGDPE